jgi:hypothetical protein
MPSARLNKNAAALLRHGGGKTKVILSRQQARFEEALVNKATQPNAQEPAAGSFVSHSDGIIAQALTQFVFHWL